MIVALPHLDCSWFRSGIGTSNVTETIHFFTVKIHVHVREFFSGNDNAVPKLQEPVKAAEPVAETPAPKAYTKEEVRAILADLSQNGFRNEAKALVRKYSDGGSLTDIDPAKYPDLVAEAEALHG